LGTSSWGPETRKKRLQYTIGWSFELDGIKAIKCRRIQAAQPKLEYMPIVEVKRGILRSPQPSKRCPVRKASLL